MVHEKMLELQQLGLSWVEVQFMKKAVDILCQCRKTLMYTYAFAFYLKKNNPTQLFEVTGHCVIIIIIIIIIRIIKVI